MTFSTTTFSIMTLCINYIQRIGIVTPSIKDTEHIQTLWIKCPYIESHYDECLNLLIVMVNVVMLNVVAPEQMISEKREERVKDISA